MDIHYSKVGSGCPQEIRKHLKAKDTDFIAWIIEKDGTVITKKAELVIAS